MKQDLKSSVNLPRSIHDFRNSLNFTLHGDYYFPDLQQSVTDRKQLSHFGRIRLNYLWEHRPGLYTRLIPSSKLYEHLAEIDQTSRRRIEQIILAQAEGIDEKLKAKDQMTWVCRMNNIRQRAEETILQELIYE